MKKTICLLNSLLILLFLITFQGCNTDNGEVNYHPPEDTNTSPPTTTIQISGFAYERQAAISYSLDLSAVNSKIECTTISLDDASSSCQSNGGYSIALTDPDYQPMVVTHNGYIPTQYAIWGENDQNLNIGLYPAPTVTARPGFMKGMVFLDLQNTYPNLFWTTIMDEPISRMNAELVSHVEIGFGHSCDTNAHSVSISSSHPDYPDWRMSTKEELAPLVTKVHDAGGAFNLWLGIINVNECGNGVIFNVAKDDSAFWDDWFSNYRIFLINQTNIAKDLGIEWITLGHNMDYVSSLAASRWESIITEMREIYPTLKISYFGGVNFDETPPYFESDAYNEGSPDGFASLLDALGHAVTAVSNTINPSREMIKTTFETIKTKTSTLSVPIWIMPMTPSTTVGASDSTFMEPELLTDNSASNYTRDFYQQADVYQALFEVINGSPTGNGQIMGVLPWGYHLKNNYTDSGPESNSSPNVNNLIVDRTANVRGKPAESILKWWFEQF